MPASSGKDMGEILNSSKGFFNDNEGRTALVILVALALVGAGFGIWKWSKRPKDPCATDEIEIVIKDESMRPMLKGGDEVEVVKGYYACKPVERGDWVAFQLGEKAPVMVRVAVGVPGDTYELLPNEKLQRWQIKINGELYEPETDGGKQAYFFGTLKARPVLVLGSAKGENKGTVREGEVLLLSNVPPGFMDSGVTGKRLLAETLGKVNRR